MLVIKITIVWQAITASPITFSLCLGTVQDIRHLGNFIGFIQTDLESLHVDWKLVKGMLRDISLSLS